MAQVPNVMSRPKPFAVASLGPAPQQPLEVPESGTLPGEEQVTTQDTLRQLPVPVQKALRQKYETSGHAGAVGFDDWLSDYYGDLPPEKRAAEMTANATSTPRVQVGKDPSLPAGVNSPLADARRAAGKPLPEGREPQQYSPEQRRTMSRNVYNPEVPMSRFGGTFTHNANGSVSERAANPELLAQAQAIAADPSQGPESDSYIVALALAHGIDVYQYGNDMDLLRSDTLREHQRHEAKRAVLGTQSNGMGGTRYVSDPKKAAAARAKREADMTPERKAQFANTILRRFGPMMSEEERQGLGALINTPDGFTKMRELHGMLEQRRTAGIADRLKDRTANYNITRDLQNPRFAPGMQIRGLLQAVDENNPMALSVLQGIYGNPEAAAHAMQMAQQREHDAAGFEQAALGMRNRPAPPATQSEQLKGELAVALANDDPAQRYTAVRNIVVQLPGNEALASTPEGEKVIEAKVQDLIAGHYASTGQQPHLVQAHLNSLLNDKPRFVRFLVEHYHYSPTQADDYYNKLKPTTTARDMGRQAAESVGGFFGGIGSFVDGLGDAILPSKPK